MLRVHHTTPNQHSTTQASIRLVADNNCMCMCMCMWMCVHVCASVCVYVCEPHTAIDQCANGKMRKATYMKPNAMCSAWVCDGGAIQAEAHASFHTHVYKNRLSQYIKQRLLASLSRFTIYILADRNRLPFHCNRADKQAAERWLFLYWFCEYICCVRACVRL